MKNYNCIMALIEPNPGGEQVAMRAMDQARLHRAGLVLATLVDYDTGCESDHVPFKTPGELLEEMRQDIHKRLRVMADRIGAGEKAGIVTALGRNRQAVIALAGSVGAELVLVHADTPFYLLDNTFWRQWFPAPRIPFDVLVVQGERRPLFPSFPRQPAHEHS